MLHLEKREKIFKVFFSVIISFEILFTFTKKLISTKRRKISLNFVEENILTQNYKLLKIRLNEIECHFNNSH